MWFFSKNYFFSWIRTIYLCIFGKKIKNGYYSGGFGQKNATKYHFFVKKRAMGACKFPLTIFFWLSKKISKSDELHEVGRRICKKIGFTIVFLSKKNSEKSNFGWGLEAFFAKKIKYYRVFLLKWWKWTVPKKVEKLSQILKKKSSSISADE